MDGSCNNLVVVFVWLLTLSNVDLCIRKASCEVQCIPSEQDALLKMKRHLSDPSNRLASWSPHGNCCNWAFVICHNITGHVLQLHLTTPPPSELHYMVFNETLNFGGEVHSSLLGLKHLNYLDLSNNDFGGMQIPTFLGSITSLIYLNLSNAVFGGNIPHQIAKLSNLQYLDLRGNEFSGSIIHQIGKLSNLQYLDLRGNEFSGSIPHQIGNLSNLQYLDLGDNQFSGSIPHQIGNLSNLINLHLGYRLSIPIENLQWVSALSSLQYLELSYANLSNTFDWLQILHSLPSLRELHLLECDFNHHFEPSIINFSSLAVLHLSDSYFGTSLIPNWVFQLKRLVHLQLNNNSFQGPIPVGIQNLTLLQHLDLSYNQFNSSIPDWLYNFGHLKSLNLFQSYIVGTISVNIGNLTSLITLDFNYNLLNGPIPISMGNLCNLKKLALSNNKCNHQISEILKILSAGCVSQALEIFYMSSSQLSGHLTDQISLFKNLVELDLSDNSIQGPIPNSLGNLASLKYLDLSGNSIKGALPSSLGNLKSLIYLSLWNNTINSAIPISFGNLTSLMHLVLTKNQLDGNPFEILGSLSKLTFLSLGYNLFQGVVKEAHFENFTHLQTFWAPKNQLTLKVDPNWNPSFLLLEGLSLNSWNLGPQFPSWIQSLKHLWYLDISNAMIYDSIPTLFWGAMGNIQYLNISYNHIEGELSTILINTIFGGAVDLSSNKLHGQLPYVSQNVTYIDLSSNWFSGPITHFLCHRQEETKALQFLKVTSNNLSSNLPDCWMSWPYLTTVNLANNHLSGMLNTSMASLSELQMLNLRNNNFSGNFPSFLMNKSNLICLDLGENQFSGILPSWVGQRLSSLKILVLRSNQFSGPIPHQICDMSFLQILDLAHNKLIGYIPKCVEHLSAMSIINGSLESSIYSAQQIDGIYFTLFVEALLVKGRFYDYSSNLGLVTSIDFSSNELSREIPTEFTSLKGLHFLNLSNNHFIGQIPQKIGHMESLESIDLSRNLLSGTQLQSFEASSFIGNDLCGPPLNSNCSSNSPTNAKDKEVHHENGINWFFVSMALGFIVGFWVVVGPLLYSTSWRYAYYQFIDRIWYKLQYHCYW
ncbi:receptor-like protein EIX2 [Neltuma alba]|uniref:receptor-like protein EIX2 n=1 Tax=Neltuma alba TaxID=207710 RepID=UPI0010A3AE2A|nr:receptor-like protein EIX2 [Prosopis alba]